MPNPTQPPRRRGAQNGNQNALKHGFYAAGLPAADLADLGSYEFCGLQEEIDVLRLIIRRVVEKSDPNAPLPEILELLRTLSLASMCLTRLVRTHLIVDPQGAVAKKERFDTALADLADLNRTISYL